MDILSASESTAKDTRDHDFWDHLRRIHFFIVGASMVLALGALAREEGRLFTAYQLIKEVDSVAARPLPNFDSLKAVTVIANAPDTLLVYTGDALGMLGTPVSDSIHPRYRITISRKVLYFPDLSGSRALVDRPRRRAWRAPATLRDWAALWDSIGGETSCRLDTALYRVKVDAPTGAGPAQLYGRKPDPRHPISQAREELAGSYVADSIDGGLSAKVFAGRPVVRGSLADSLGLGHTTEYRIRITCAPQPMREARSALASLIGVRWNTGRYSQSFADLEYFLGDGRVPLGEARNILRYRIENGSADVQVVGIPLPSRLLVSGGFALLIGLQLYFLLHLRAVLRRVHAGATQPEIAWIGAYDDVISWICYTISVCALPLFTGWVLLATALERSHHNQWQNVSAYAVLGVLCLTTLFFHPRQKCDPGYRRAIRRATQIILGDPAAPPATATSAAADASADEPPKPASHGETAPAPLGRAPAIPDDEAAVIHAAAPYGSLPADSGSDPEVADTKFPAESGSAGDNRDESAEKK